MRREIAEMKIGAGGVDDTWVNRVSKAHGVPGVTIAAFCEIAINAESSWGNGAECWGEIEGDAETDSASLRRRMPW